MKDSIWESNDKGPPPLIYYTKVKKTRQLCDMEKTQGVFVRMGFLQDTIQESKGWWTWNQTMFWDRYAGRPEIRDQRGWKVVSLAIDKEEPGSFCV